MVGGGDDNDNKYVTTETSDRSQVWREDSRTITNLQSFRGV